MRRYSAESGMSASGTCSSESSGSATASLRQVITIPAASAKASVEKTARWIPSRFPFPVIWEITTFAPIEMPMKNVTMKLMMGVLLPTAAIASFPTNCPMMMVSMVLNTCCSMPVNARNSAKRIVFLPIGPCVISIFFIYIFSYIPLTRQAKGRHRGGGREIVSAPRSRRTACKNIFLIITFLTTCPASALPLAKDVHWLYDIEEPSFMHMPFGYRKACLKSD